MADEVWNSGDWQVALRDDEFADIKFQGQTVLRSVRAVVRDQDWNTADLVLDSAIKNPNEIKFLVHSEGFGAELVGEVCAIFENTNATFTMNFESKSDFLTNRTGLIVLHSPQCAGSDLKVTHPNGVFEAVEFPKQISPTQPVFDIASLAWTQNNLQIDVAFAGEIFEMEDQRNWSDASFKTYSRPLSEPFPYLLAENEKVQQIVKISVTSVGIPADSESSKTVELNRAGKFPQIQLGAATSGNPKIEPDSILSRVLVELDLVTTNWPAALERAAKSAKYLDVRIIASAKSNLLEVARRLSELNIARVAIFDSAAHVTTKALLRSLKEALATMNLDIPVVSGARSHFTELNREQEQILPDASEITFATTPLFHSLTDAQLYESVAIQRTISEQAAKMANGRPVHVGPICLRPRFNNVATAPQPKPIKEDLVDGYGAQFTGSSDHRQQSQELAAWVIAAAAALTVSGVQSLTWFEQWGERGVVSETGYEYPAAQAIRALAALECQDLYIGESLDGWVWALAGIDEHGQASILTSNLSTQPERFEIKLEGKTYPIELGARCWSRLSNKIK